MSSPMPVDARPPPARTGKVRRLGLMAAAVLATYLAIAYLAAPWMWERYADRHPAFDDNPRLTETGDGHPGDPLNVGLVASEAEIKAMMTKAGWYGAAALGLRSDLEIAEATVLERSDDAAPVSRLLLFGRQEDLAFEQPVGKDPRQRNHVRLWRTDKTASDGRPAWIGAASYDERVGLSYTTGQITHHIAGDVDRERDHLFADLEATGRLEDVTKIAGYHTVLNGTNGGGDRWHTDGALWVGVVKTSPE